MAQYQKLDPKIVWNHYNRPEILKIMVEASIGKECVGSYGGTGYAKRPNVIEYPQDILEEVKRGVTSFHASEELWNNPLQISTDLSKQDLSKLRNGWDLLLDIDCKELMYSQIAGDIIYQMLIFHNVHSVGCKFSGNHGFHFIVPYEAFPQSYNGVSTKLMFPEVARVIAEYLMHVCDEVVSKKLFEYEQQQNPNFTQEQIIEHIAKKSAKEIKDILKPNNSLDGFKVVGIDTVLITSRHLYRQVYSLNEKSGLVSLPINPKKILQFNRDLANAEDLTISRFTFLDRTKAKPNEAIELVTQAYDFYAKKKAVLESIAFANKSTKKVFESVDVKIPEQFFPPIIQAMLKPLDDGKKRALFVLMRFLRSAGHTKDEVETMLTKWNQAHQEPLRDTYFNGQMKYFLAQEQAMMPPNYSDPIYAEIGGDLVKQVTMKNPLAEAKRAFFRYAAIDNEEKKKEARKKKKEEKKAKEEQDSVEPAGVDATSKSAEDTK